MPFEEMAGLMATALVVFVGGLILSILAMKKSDKWVQIVEFCVVIFGAILMLAALCLYYKKASFWAPLMGGIAMTLAMETSAFLLIDVIA